MALSSSTGYDVFVSFRGEDIRRTFVSHLYRSLERKGIRTFKAETELNLEPSEIHLAAIRASKIAIVVITKNYISSPWILRELDEILNCHRSRYLTVFPVYYGVDSCDVEGLAEEFSTDQKQNPEKVGISAWRNALTELVCISGEHSNKWEDDAELILKIANAIWNKLSLGTEKSSFCASNYKDTSLTGNTAFKCVGMDSHIQAVSGLMELESENEIRIVGIWGVGGVGKMTLARCVYEETMQYFHIHVFLENVGKIYQDHGASGLNEELLWDNIIRQAFTERSSKNSFDVTKARLQNRKLLLVVDGVNNKEQLEDVQNVATWFGAGSRVLVTTRDENLLLVNGITHVYEVKCLRVHEALQLFYHFAFTEQSPSTHFKQLSVRAVQLAGHIPLSLKVLGSFLCGKRALQWESELQTLAKQRVNEKAKVGVTSDKKPDDYRNVNMAIGSDMTASKVITYPKEKTHVTSYKKPDDYRNVKMAIGSDVTASKVITYRKEKTHATTESENIYGLLFTPFWGTFSNFRNTSETQSVVAASPNSLTIPIEMLGHRKGMILNFTHILGHFFGVYDGYCGSQVAGFYCYILNSAFTEEIERMKDSIYNTAPMENWQVQWKKVFTKFFQRIDEKAAARISFATTGSSDRVLEAVALEFVGSTAVVALICLSHIIVSNRGNYRAVLLRSKESMPLTVDHKPDREEEDVGKEKAGGEVIQSQGIITNSGDLKTSRSTGDRNLKPYIIPDPEVTFLPRTREDVCLILASDGLWDVMSNQEACDFVRKQILETKEPSYLTGRDVWENHACKEAAENLFRLALQKGSKDDISIIVFNLRR